MYYFIMQLTLYAMGLCFLQNVEGKNILVNVFMIISIY